MTNEEYQRQAAERSRQADEARRRQSIEDFNRNERERAARNAQIQKENYSRSLGNRGLNPPLFGPPVDGPTYNRARQSYEANQKLFGQFNQTFSSGSSASGYSGGSGKAKSAGAGVLLLLIVLAVVVYSGSNSNSTGSQSSKSSSPPSDSPSTASSDLQPPAAIPKPSPINSDRFQPQPLPTDPAMPSATATPPLYNGTTAATTPFVPPAENAVPSFPYGVQMAANRDGMNNGCKHGSLVFEATAIDFICPSDSDKNVAVSVEQVRDLDNNGIVVFPKQKYHFDIEGRQKEDVRDLFALWLTNARRTASTQARN